MAPRPATTGTNAGCDYDGAAWSVADAAPFARVVSALHEKHRPTATRRLQVLQAAGEQVAGAAAGGGALYGVGIFGALFHYWQQVDSFWEYIWRSSRRRSSGQPIWSTRDFRALGA